VGSDAGQVHVSAIRLDEQQQVQPGQPDRLDRQKVAGRHASGLSA
jgi:hypothetical protein